MMTVTISQVPNKLVERLWPQCVPILEKAREYWERYYDLKDIKERCIKGNMQLWVQVIDKKIVTVLVTELISYPKCIYLRYTLIAGKDLRVAKKYVYIIENWAKLHGAVGWEILGRAGWLRFASKTFGEPEKQALWLSGKFGD